jgi:uncharacterized protein (TIGR00730 family)
MIESVCVYCASSTKVAPVYLEVAREVGVLLAKNNIHCIYGGGSVGLMGSLAEGVLSENGMITGIIPRFMCDLEWNHSNLSELILVDTMHERKELMMQKAKAAIALPGGIGTFEELMEAICWRKLGLFNQPIYIFNINNYYSDLIKMLENAVDEKFMDTEDLNLWKVVNNIDEFFAELTANP